MDHQQFFLIILCTAGILAFLFSWALGAKRRLRKKSRAVNSRKNNRHTRNVARAKQIFKNLHRFSEAENGQARLFGYLRKIDPYVFEELMLEAFAANGYRIRRNQSYSGDGGIDGLVIAPDGTEFLLQVKRYSQAVKSQHLLEFDQLCRKNKSRGFFIHTGKTPAGLNKIENRQSFEIISGKKLAAWLLEAAGVVS